MTVATFLIFLVAVSLIVGYVVIIHRSLSGAAANDPSYDVDAPAAKAAPALRSTKDGAPRAVSVGGQARHA